MKTIAIFISNSAYSQVPIAIALGVADCTPLSPAFYKRRSQPGKRLGIQSRKTGVRSLIRRLGRRKWRNQSAHIFLPPGSATSATVVDFRTWKTSFVRSAAYL